MSDKADRQLSILLVEDNAGDVLLVREALEEAGFPHALPVAVLSTSPSESAVGGEFPSLRITFAAKTPDFRELIETLCRFSDFAIQTA